MHSDTIAAISTPPGEGGIGIVRISGPRALNIGLSVFRFARLRGKPKSHYLYYGHVVDPGTGEVVDEALFSYMAAPRTYTREDVVEINCHGGILPLGKTLGLVLAAGARAAQPGEFTQRAFLNGRLDLAQAEAVIQLIRAKTETALKLGIGQLKGNLSREIMAIRKRLLAVLAHIEAAVDFPEHQDVEDMARERLQEEIAAAMERLQALLATADRGRIMREGLKTAIVGRPNVGKSSLLNSLLDEQRAIVTDIPGTTRDVLEESINIAGIALNIIDTAGIRQATDEVEKMGVARTRQVLEKADLVLFMLDGSCGFTLEDREIYDILGDKPVIVILNKADLVKDVAAELEKIKKEVPGVPVVAMSLLENTGLDELEKAIIGIVFSGKAEAAEPVMVTTVRHKNALQRAYYALCDLQDALYEGFETDLLAIDLYTALDALGEITGESVRSELLTEIFSTFCIGK